MIAAAEHLLAAGVKEPDKWLAPVQSAMARFGINTPRQIAAFLAQCAHESGGFTMLRENLNYRAVTLAAVWPKRFALLGADGKPLKDDKGKNRPTKIAQSIAGKPELIANMVYSNRMGNGPAESGDGWKFAGKGLKQLTGKDNFTRCGKAIELDLVNDPDLLLQPEGAALSAAWFWWSNKCGPIADAGDFVRLTRVINGGVIGLEDRTKRYNAALAAMGQG